MCGRFALVTDLTKIAEEFAVEKIATAFPASWNISPGQHIPAVIRQNGQNSIETFLWGLIPSTAKDPSIGNKLKNARAETISERPSFRAAFKKRRCLIVADGFYEWKTEGAKKIPLYFYLKSEEPFGLAASCDASCAYVLFTKKMNVKIVAPNIIKYLDFMAYFPPIHMHEP